MKYLPMALSHTCWVQSKSGYFCLFACRCHFFFMLVPHMFVPYVVGNGHFPFRIFLRVYIWTVTLILRLNHRSMWRWIRRVDAGLRCWLGEQHACTQSSQQLENSRSVNAHYITVKCVILCSAQIMGLGVCLCMQDVCYTLF